MRTLLIGAFVFGLGCVLVLAPLALPRFDWNKYLVTFGLIFALLGAVITFNALIDVVRRKR